MFFQFKKRHGECVHRLLRFLYPIPFCIVSLIISFFLELVAQPASINFRHLSVADGLSQSSVFAFAQDSMGFLWIGTEDGLNRYDGYSFKVYKHDLADSTSLSNSWIECLYVDSRGSLWIGTFGGGLNRYDQKHDRFICYEHTPNKQDRLPNNFVRAIAEDTKGVLWVGTQDGLSHFDPIRGSWKTFRNDPKNSQSISHNHIRTLLYEKRGRLWIGTIGGGVNRYDETTGMFTRYVTGENGQNKINHNNVRTIAEDDSGRVWVGTRAGIDRYDEKMDLFVPVSLSVNGELQENIFDVIADHRGSLWIATNVNGLLQFNLSTGSVRQFRNEPTEPQSLSIDNIWRLFIDRSGVVWIGTLGGGVNVHSGIRKPFFHLHHTSQNTNTLFASITWSILQDRQGILWVGTDGSVLNRYNPKTGMMNHISFEPLGIGDFLIRALCEDRNGTLWIGVGNGWFGWVDRKKNRFVEFKMDTQFTASIRGKQVRAIIEGDTTTLWIGISGGGLCRLNPKSGAFTNYRNNHEDSTSLSNNSVIALLNDDDAKLWVGTQEGLNLFDPLSNRFVRFRNDPDNAQSLSSDYVNCIFKDRKGNLWVGTRLGLNKFNKNDGTFIRYFEKDGLPNDVVYGILEDQQGFLWLSTNKGISRFNPSTKTFRNYDESDGIGGNEFNSGAYFKGVHGMIYFGGVHGVTAFNPGMIADNPVPPSVVLTNVDIFRKPLVTGQAIPAVSEISMEYSERFFSFEYAALDFTSPGKNRYAYKLEGFDEEWIDAGTRRFGSYTNLDPGKYTLRIKAANSDGVWNEKGREINLTVIPAYWQTWWFRIVILAIVITGIASLYQYRVNKLLAVERMRNRIARDLHDDVSATLSGINYFAESIRQQTAGLNDGARRFINLIEESAVSAQESINDIVWSLNPDNDSWENVLTKFRRYASDLFDSKGIHYTITIPASLNIPPLDMERRRDLWLIYKEMVTNIARHSECTEAEIKFSSLEDRSLELFIRDNGKGFDPNSQSDRNGLKNIRSRAQKFRSELSLETHAGNGVRWNLRFQV